MGKYTISFELLEDRTATHICNTNEKYKEEIQKLKDSLNDERMFIIFGGLAIPKDKIINIKWNEVEN